MVFGTAVVIGQLIALFTFRIPGAEGARGLPAAHPALDAGHGGRHSIAALE